MSIFHCVLHIQSEWRDFGTAAKLVHFLESLRHVFLQHALRKSLCSGLFGCSSHHWIAMLCPHAIQRPAITRHFLWRLITIMIVFIKRGKPFYSSTLENQLRNWHNRHPHRPFLCRRCRLCTPYGLHYDGTVQKWLQCQLSWHTCGGLSLKISLSCCVIFSLSKSC